ncbi:substrate-binding domain-containing protein [Balneolales bacterium ANBcel1]|nr:substrate-binding domain-containing protein [Balneolales bacterium ANBcel1]
MKNILIILSFLLLATAMQASGQSFKVIVNNDNSVASISKSDLSAIFLKTNTRWADGSTIEPVDQSARSAVREVFSQEVHGRNVGAIRSHWQQAAFSGAGTAPLERGSDADVVQFVQSNPGAIGYVSADANVSGVKTISVQ